MTLEELMVYSILVRKLNKESDDEELIREIMYDYNKEVLSIEFFQKVKQNMMFYGNEGEEIVSKVQDLVRKMVQAPKIEEFDSLFSNLKRKDEDIETMVETTNRKINESMFWNEHVNVVDVRVDAKERKYYEALMKINRYNSMVMDPQENIFVDIEHKNAIDMQRAYKKMLLKSNEKQKEGWIISQVQLRDNTIRYRLVFYSLDKIKNYINSGKCIKYINNLWGIENVNLSGNGYDGKINSKAVYCGIGRVTNLRPDDFKTNNEVTVIKKIEAKKGSELPEYEKNPLKIIETYIGQKQVKYSISPEDFLWILNKRESNYRCLRRVSQRKCVICGSDTQLGYITCGKHIINYGDW